jgi:LPXTG-site transpeptidase (sortase) family protein
VSIPSIGLDLPVFFGGQATIDRGVVTHYDGSGWRPPVAVGQPGTYWLAAHHLTHGAPFRNLPSVRPGEIVTITPVGRGPVVRYEITSVQLVPVVVSFATVYGPDTTTARLLLQTCEGAASRVLVHGVAIQG